MLGEKVRAKSLVDAVAERLEAAIISGDLTPGSRLSEQALANQLGVSRGPLREAIRRLEGRKLLQRTPNIGVRVVALSLQDIIEILQVQEVLQGMATALAAEQIEDEELQGLKDLVARQRRSLETGRGHYRESLDLEFHERIIAASKNERLIRMLQDDISYLLRVQRYKFSPGPEDAKTLIAEHERIVEALEKRDPDLAEKRMRQHIGKAWQIKEAQLAAEGDGSEAADIDAEK